MHQNFQGPRVDINATLRVIAEQQQQQVLQAQRERHSLDHTRELNLADHATISAYVAKQAPDGLPCMCGKREWGIEPTLVNAGMVVIFEGQVRLASRLAPDIALTASCCGERRYLCAVQAGVLPAENLQPWMLRAVQHRVPLVGVSVGNTSAQGARQSE